MTGLSDTWTRHPSLPDPTAPLTASGNLRRRTAVSGAIGFTARAAAILAVFMLIDVAFTVVQKGAPVLSFGFLTQNSNGLAGGGIANALLGTIVIVAFAAVLALPVGVLTGIYLTEFAGPRSRLANILKATLDLLQGLPTIIVGIVVFGLIVSATHKETGFAGAIALAVIMLPMIARSSQEVLTLVPGGLREAADALGVEHWRAVVSVILPAAAGGIATGAILSIARAAGETAPLLILNSLYNPSHTQLEIFGQGVPSIPMYIYTTYDLPAPSAIARAWGAALVLLVAILAANVGARADVAVPGRVRIHTDGVSAPVTPQVETEAPREPVREVVFDIKDMAAYYGKSQALGWTTLKIYRHLVTAIIGPSGCGKSTFIRSLNRMNDAIPGFRVEGQVHYHGHDVYAGATNRVEVRRRIGMVFQKPNPFPKSIYDNIAWAPRNLGMRSDLDARVERALTHAALWDEVKDRLKESALGLSGGQQQRLCIARALAIEPDVLLLDEPASALDPIATASIEDLMHTLKHRYTIVIVTHNMQQAARVADRTAFFGLDSSDGQRVGTLIEYGDTQTIFRQPRDTRTRDYVSGRFG